METTRLSRCPTLLRFPPLGSGLLSQEVQVPGEPSDYIVQQHGAWWMVTRQSDQATVYAGPGPVSVLRSSAPF